MKKVWEKIKDYFRNLGRPLKKANMRYGIFYSLIIIAMGTVFFTLNMRGDHYSYNVGDIAKENIRVNGTILYEEEAKTAIKRQEAADAVALIFEKDSYVFYEKKEYVDSLFSHVKNTLTENPVVNLNDTSFHLYFLKQRLPKYLRYRDDVLVTLLKSKDLDALQRVMLRTLANVYSDGVLDQPYHNSLKIPNTSVVVRIVKQDNSTEEIYKKVKDLRDCTSIRLDQDRYLYKQMLNSGGYRLNSKEKHAVYYICSSMIKPNLKFSATKTERAINETKNKVSPIMATLKEGQVLIREGDTITKNSLQKIEVLNRYATNVRIYYILGIIFLQLLFFYIVFKFINKGSRSLLPDTKAATIIFSLLIIFEIVVYVLAKAPILQNSDIIFALLLPISCVVMILTVLYNYYMALTVSIFLILYTFILSGYSTSTLIVALTSCAVGILTMNKVERRTDFLRSGLFVGIINSLLVVAIGLIEDFTGDQIMYNILAALGSGFFNVVIALGVYPFYENAFGLTTRFKLFELSDLNAPIFKQMLIKAPGTYNHSLMVANMAEAACKEINANYMLARVGGYYHDIGKINNPGLFIENKGVVKGENNYPPHEYADLIIDHVRTGVKMAEEAKLPTEVVDFVREHHADSIMTFFYHQALEEAANSENQFEVQKSDFQYPGPKPHSKETAIVMLADAVEAASRSMKDPTYVKLEGLVKKIIRNKLNDNLLDNTNLTMKELEACQKAFLSILNGIFHTRLEYPEESDIAKLEEKVLQNNDDN